MNGLTADPGMWALLLGGALTAGWIDAVVGGGGLVLIPLLLIVFPELAPAKALASNKLAAIWGTATAALLFVRRNGVDWRLATTGFGLGALGAAVGASLASAISADVMRPVVIVLMIAVGVFICAKPTFGQNTDVPAAPPDRRRLLIAVGLFCIIGFYDGIFGPGTGMFLILSLSGVLSADFLTSATLAKVVNTGTNFGALTVFAIQGNVLWLLGLTLAVANVAGSVIGSKMTLKAGTGFVRYALLAVVVVMSVKLLIDQFG